MLQNKPTPTTPPCPHCNGKGKKPLFRMPTSRLGITLYKFASTIGLFALVYCIYYGMLITVGIFTQIVDPKRELSDSIYTVVEMVALLLFAIICWGIYRFLLPDCPYCKGDKEQDDGQN